jgi:co-chaperonin GroES (HSP10)
LSSYAQSTINWQSIFNSLKDYRQKAIEQNQYEQLLWTEIYRPRNSKTYLGSHTKQIRRLNEWFSYWKKKLNNDEPKKSGRKRRRNYDDNSDEDFIDESNTIYYNRCQSKQEHPQIIYIHGCGTTSLVHALAEEHHFKVTEINGSQSRARASLIKQLEQVTSHHYLSLKRCASDTIISQEEKSKANISLPVKKKAKNERGTIMSFFNNKKSEEIRRPSRRNKKESQPISSDIHFGSSVQVEKTSLILFDEIETLTVDDNFWSCLKKLFETAKKPIILTSNSRSNPDDAIFNLSKLGDYEMIHLEPIEPVNPFCFSLKSIFLFHRNLFIVFFD